MSQNSNDRTDQNPTDPEYVVYSAHDNFTIELLVKPGSKVIDDSPLYKMNDVLYLSSDQGIVEKIYVNDGDFISKNTPILSILINPPAFNPFSID